ncbi:MAG: hypothetical protein A2X25_14075 [Chloroflexi bacterium GWB2_49_20]|nr:MAG: hypothetical protein A2X25_14075 [Chloroflexi bacterium GWB2_49_20]OGN79899.1 MAG: hypothetical protein A2X26_02675 [Chloroflexi bacterium GWC2_49_37]OGN85566.1 MAG: hypothetical protein A2X27_04385 [Chloroflexi bacterium GWD2_49_16]HBG74442.1 hypothetical protein [Anaerolineae bacterium]HCC79591.1 hypothetical protein [Anaerolineae bacterium]
MTIEFDDKGKFYTDLIKKNPVPATIMTLTFKISGVIYVRPDQRIKDELDLNEKFLAVTDAKVYSLQGEIMYQCGFIAVQRTQIVWVIPDSEL